MLSNVLRQSCLGCIEMHHFKSEDVDESVKSEIIFKLHNWTYIKQSKDQ